ncbi:MAG: hypothetical protein ACK4GO_11735 [Gemmobacter sp.]
MLDRHGLIRLAPNPGDGRSKCVWITEAGRAFRNRAIAALDGDLDDIAARFPVERLAEVLPVLTDLRRVMDAMRDGPSALWAAQGP